MKSLADEMALAGRKLEDEELISYILTGMDLDFDSIVSTMEARVEPITMNELYAQLVAHEQRMEIRGGGQQSSANMAAKGGCGNYSNNGSRGGGHGNRGGFSSGGQKVGHGGGRFQPRVYCQLCGKEGQPVVRCFKRFDASFSGPPQKSASTATSSYGVDTNWYMDTGAKYHGGEQVHAAKIWRSLMLVITFCIPLISICKISFIFHKHIRIFAPLIVTRDNNVFLEFHHDHFSIKEQVTKKTLHKGRCERGLYPLRPSPNKQALGVIKPSVAMASSARSRLISSSAAGPEPP